MIIQQAENKLCRGIESYIRLPNKENIKVINFADNVYKVKFQNPQCDRFFFFYSLLNRSIVQFLEEFASAYQIYIYHDVNHSKILDNITNIVPSYKVTNIEENKNIVRVPHIYNNIDFYSQKKEKTIKYSCFVGSYTDPGILEGILVKQKNIAIFDYNKPNRCNLGKTTESEKNIILNQTKNYIDTNGEYLVEAVKLGCSVFNLNNEKKTISELQNHSIDNITINEFLKDIIKL